MKLSLSTPFILIIKLYQITLSPLMGNSCKFYPSCSHYAIEAFQKRGVFAGIYLTTKRILRCNPFSKGGYDPVPCEHKH
jgi:putative membrane protein insertion efficiency factor